MNWRPLLLLACARMATIASPLLFILWITSAWYRFAVRAGPDLRFETYAGRLEIRCDPTITLKGLWLYSVSQPSFNWWFDAQTLGTQWGFWTPLWLPLMAAIVAAIFFRDRYRKAIDRDFHGRCRACGYSIIATDNDSMCPECGKPLFARR